GARHDLHRRPALQALSRPHEHWYTRPEARIGWNELTPALTTGGAPGVLARPLRGRARPEAALAPKAPSEGHRVREARRSPAACCAASPNIRPRDKPLRALGRQY